MVYRGQKSESMLRIKDMVGTGPSGENRYLFFYFVVLSVINRTNAVPMH